MCMLHGSSLAYCQDFLNEDGILSQRIVTMFEGLATTPGDCLQNEIPISAHGCRCERQHVPVIQNCQAPKLCFIVLLCCLGDLSEAFLQLDHCSLMLLLVL
eukprot:CAMPEP_0197695686 /NCGR_PEP_ID=MMETSP1338-20131121/115522_1 /TAXON_ID=43686 ORGANISM="Pelagodinium beii, Strain RCC1491" /NCGR_SAMPLE_ID=MMETSP1338 /ASSEMBLY_ACC=CAM_ASM_000754 /LENGTH=100 /DNA_ID=CAMNT_0043278697 /DNA_START=108 /DNA_END=407 /DNA_ORIENTATION=-